MDVVHLLVVLTVITSIKCQGINFWNGFQGMDMFMGGFDWKKAWDNFAESFKEMSEQFKKMKPMPNWFDGQNVCFTDFFRTDPFFEEHPGLQGVEFENCRGTNFKFVCIARMFVNGKSQQRIRTYECCPGFVGRFDNGMKCVKSN
ncbi:hypothetical protein JTE90_021445 [Oedothorax gibbosus]|uniref:Uncharacterized protein n=1 Tax=Oedothorax gibbosus TaxID=931172 RepID=A0AAV6VZK3_9ARAC|nr:hypothetical protein JTE90_021445 [Oedothorax gibbosus]